MLDKFQITNKTKKPLESQQIWQIVIFVTLLTLPHITDGFRFGFGGENQDKTEGNILAGRAARGSIGGERNNIAKRLTSDKKFKFHKIERVYFDNYVLDDDTEDNDNIEAATRDAEAAESDEGIIRSHTSAHRAEKRSYSAKTATANNGKLISDSSSIIMLPGFLSSLFGVNNYDKKEEINSNGIIYWLKWMSERFFSKPPQIPPKHLQSDDSTSWLYYLNRWPFNSVFPIVDPVKPIVLPRNGRSQGDNNIQMTGYGNNVNQDHPMSQHHFESLLHTLPGFVTNATYVKEVECRQQLKIFRRQVRERKLWTLQMLDATGKISSGLLRGNINQFGDFDLCTQVRTLVKVTPEIPMSIRGKYCLAHIETRTHAAGLKVPLYLAHGRELWSGHLGNPNHFAPPYTVANWGVCIPHACSASIVREMLENNLRPYNSTGVEFYIEVRDDDCTVRQSKCILKLMRKDKKFSACLLSIGALSLISLFALLWEYWRWLCNFVRTLCKPKLNKASKKEYEELAAVSESFETDVPKRTDIKKSIDLQNTESTKFDQLFTSMDTDMDQNVNNSLKLALDILHSFSPQRSLKTLLSCDGFDSEFSVLHVLNLGATVMLYICLKFLMIGHMPLANRDTLVETMNQPLSVLFRTPIIYSDILLLHSGFIAAYQLSVEMEQNSYIELLKRLASKAIRFLPAMYVVLCFQTWILPHIGSGPLWGTLIGQNSRLCKRQMWRNLFSVQNAIDFEDTCSPLTLQLALNVQLYLLGPLIVWLYYTDADAAFFTYGAVQAISSGIRYARTNHEQLSLTLFHGMNVSKFYRSANMIYASPISRATPYLLGIGAALLYRNELNSFSMLNGSYMVIGWVFVGLSLFWCFWSPAFGMRTDFIYSSSDAAAYAAWSPLIFGLAICWCILMCPRSNKSLLCFLSCSRPVLFLSRISFPIQMAIYVVVIWNTAKVKNTLIYKSTDLVNFQDIASILCLGLLLAILIDVPAQRIRRLIVDRIFIKQPYYNDSEPVSEAKLSKGEQSKATSDTYVSGSPEPLYTIWSSDPQEEENKYWELRRNSVSILSKSAATVSSSELNCKENHQASEKSKFEEDNKEENTETEEAA